MDDNQKLWVGKRIYVRLKNSTRAYSGHVLDENETSILIKDMYGNFVRISLDEIGILQEQKLKGDNDGTGH